MLQYHPFQGKLLVSMCSWLPHATETGHWRRHTLWKSPPREQNQTLKPPPPAMLLQRPLLAKLNVAQLQREIISGAQIKFHRPDKRDKLEVEGPQTSNDTFLKYAWKMGDINLGKDTCVLPSSWSTLGNFHHKWK